MKTKQVPVPAAALAAIPAEVMLPLYVDDNIRCKTVYAGSRAYRPHVDPGCWLVTAMRGRWGIVWARSEDSLADAVAKCAALGGKVRGKSPALLIQWQPRDAWTSCEGADDDVGPPWIDEGTLKYWGSPAPVTLYANG